MKAYKSSKYRGIFLKHFSIHNNPRIHGSSFSFELIHTSDFFKHPPPPSPICFKLKYPVLPLVVLSGLTCKNYLGEPPFTTSTTFYKCKTLPLCNAYCMRTPDRYPGMMCTKIMPAMRCYIYTVFPSPLFIYFGFACP